MAKSIHYDRCIQVNIGTFVEEVLVDKIVPCCIICETQAQYDANIKIATKEAKDGTLYVTGEFEQLAIEPTPQEDTDAMLIDHEYRLTLLELGLVE